MVWTTLSLNLSGKELFWFCFLEKETSVACLLGSRLKDIFHWWAYSLSSLKCDFKLFWASLSFLTVKKVIFHHQILYILTSFLQICCLWKSTTNLNLIQAFEVHMTIPFPIKIFVHSEKIFVVVNFNSLAFKSFLFISYVCQISTFHTQLFKKLEKCLENFSYKGGLGSNDLWISWVVSDNW